MRRRSASSSRRGGTETLTFEHAIIATGSRPSTVPGLSIDSPRVMDSTSALDLPDIPKSLLVVGGGYIGLELGSVYAALGTKVTVVEMTPGLLPGADRDLVTFLGRRLEQTLHKVLLNARVVDMKDAKNGVKVRIDGKDLADADKEQTFERVLVSVGRKPNSTVPGLDKTRVRTRRPRLHPGRRRRGGPAEPTIFAIGDVVGEPMLAHKASAEARVAVEAALGHNVAFEPQAIPAVVFTDPGGRLVRPDRDRGAEDRAQGRDREVPVGGARPRRRDRSSRRPDQARDRSRHRAHPRRRHRRVGRR